MKLVTHKTVFTKCRTATLITLGLLITSATAFPPPPAPDETWQQVLNVQGQWISSSSTYRLSWDGRENETYFVQYSTTLVNEWIFMPGIAQGVGIWDVNLSGANEPVGFLRILPRNAVGDNEDTDDHDGDGIGNLAEITSNPQTSPLNLDSDGDGIDDGGLTDRDGDGIPTAYEIANGLDPLTPDSVATLNAYQATLTTTVSQLEVFSELK